MMQKACRLYIASVSEQQASGLSHLSVRCLAAGICFVPRAPTTTKPPVKQVSDLSPLSVKCLAASISSAHSLT